MADVTLADRVLLVDAAAEFQRLSFLDDVWTQRLAEVESVRPADVPQLQELGEKLQRGVDLCADYAVQLTEVVNKQSDTVDEFFSNVLRDERLDESERAWWKEAAERAGGPSSLVVNALESLASTAPNERVDIATKLEHIKNNERAKGDLSPGWGCALFITGAVVVGIAATVLTDGAGGAALVYAMGLAAGGGAYCGANRVFDF
jgi:hypothetical protein